MVNQTILNSLLKFTVPSITGGVTWDIIKKGGPKLIASFVKKFTENQCFADKEQCEEYFETISRNRIHNDKNPYDYAQSIYENSVAVAHEDFRSELEKWLEENKKELIDLAERGSQQSTINIKNQINKGKGQIINAGIINNY